MTKSIKTLHVRAISARATGGILQAGSLAIPCQIGRTGRKCLKREGDGATPVGEFRLVQGYYRHGAFPRKPSRLPQRPLKESDGWCDESTDRNYNRLVRLPYPASHEELFRKDGLYDVVITLDHNQRPRGRGLGSAVFFHLTRDAESPTAGCVAISRADMARLLPRLSRRTRIVVRP
ncbi:L,D-transpeptidase family protein [Aestuariivirga sp.]|uniref:L,D-transpeptidase family protein n=1 Tax=Aestuariivirga sp. TaxID=2650926 RepID=UPI0039E3A50C